MRRAGTIRGKKPTQKKRRSQLKIKYAQTLANLRLKRGKNATTQRKKIQVNRVNASGPKKFVANDRKSLPGLTCILDADMLSELVD